MTVRVRTVFQLAEGEDLPREFRLFSAGENDSTKGPVYFTEESARLVMAEAEKHKADYMIDLEHYSVMPRRVDPDRSDTNAQGYFRPEVRNGELWAVLVDWTSEGEARLRNRTQRYTSPAFLVRVRDDGTEEVVKLINCALCAMPATYEIEPLVASEQGAGAGLDSTRDTRYGRSGMKVRSKEAMAEALAALEGDEPDVAAARGTLEAAMAEGEESGGDSAESDGDEEEETEASAEDSAESEKDKPTEEDPASYSDTEKAFVAFSDAKDLRGAVAALSDRVVKLTGAASAVDGVRLLFSAFTDLRAMRETERRELVTELIALNVETPATAWADGKLTKRLSDEPLEDLRSRVKIFRAAKPEERPVTPPAGDDAEVSALTESERARAKSIKDPEHRARFIAMRAQINQRSQAK